MYTLIYDFDGTFKNPKGLKSSAVNTLKKFLNDKENRILILSEAPIEELISYTAPLNLNVDFICVSTFAVLAA